MMILRESRTKRPPVWVYNLLAGFLVLTPVLLMSNDGITYGITMGCFTSAALLSWVSARIRMNVLGVLLLVVSLAMLLLVGIHLCV
ncbi:MAG: hypothetical protein BWY82_03021 [Verrucomicrobia bacterium ADurb.Bin474]|nr:MAG: hypothetical protein BWY82_03021 [Verrucomicrobia bacterium ADurb.Bin474]